MLAALSWPTKRWIWGLNCCTKDLAQSSHLINICQTNALPDKHKTSPSPGCASTEIIDLSEGEGVWRGGGQAALGSSSGPRNKQRVQSLPLFCLDSRYLITTIKAWATLLEPVSTSATKSIHTWSAQNGRMPLSPTTHSCTLHRQRCRALHSHPLVPPSSQMSIFTLSLCLNPFWSTAFWLVGAGQRTGFQRLVDSIQIFRNRLETIKNQAFLLHGLDSGFKTVFFTK